MSLNKAIGHLALPLQPPGTLRQPSHFPMMSRWLMHDDKMTSVLRLFVNKVSKFLFTLYIALHLLHLGVACC
jgi:hypothetical protein